LDRTARRRTRVGCRFGLRRLQAINLPSRQRPGGRVSTRHQPISRHVGLKPDLQNQTMGMFIAGIRLRC
jgi:hypothetical protein